MHFLEKNYFSCYQQWQTYFEIHFNKSYQWMSLNTSATLTYIQCSRADKSVGHYWSYKKKMPGISSPNTDQVSWQFAKFCGRLCWLHKLFNTDYSTDQPLDWPTNQLTVQWLLHTCLPPHLAGDITHAPSFVLLFSLAKSII